ncbi:MAG TPA: hypothetical protein VMA54_20535 [Steroidobacteraceae bacterium]|nr:hypothetical protein [Steroidobacteraceae bacterium]
MSGYFGAKATGVHPAPLDQNCFFFSNNPALERAAARNGWTFVCKSGMPLSSEPRISSLQSKYVKFLQFDAAKLGVAADSGILYFDHKLNVTSRHVKYMAEACATDLLIRNTPRLKLTIQAEIDAGLRQKRYRETMVETVNWVNHCISTEGYRMNNRIMNTGLIYYRTVEKVRSLCNGVFNKCWDLGQPECQIIWAVLSQRYEHLITRIEWDALNPAKLEPAVEWS